MKKTKQIKRISAMQKVKNWLLLLGASCLLTQWSLKLYGLLKGYKIAFKKGSIEVRKKNRCLIINEKDCIFMPFIMRGFFDEKFNEFDAKQISNEEVLDFSKPGIHHLKNHGIDFMFVGIADAPIDTYIDKFQPTSGMIVFDVGAHVGAVSYFFSKMVGEYGKVYAFEPDDTNRYYFDVNLKNKKLNNVTILDTALGSQSGKEMFFIDGSMRSSFIENATYLPRNVVKKEVPVLTIEDCCHQLGVIPNFIKMDIEGAEIGVIKSSLEFLKKHPIHFAIESNHLTQDGFLTCYELETLFRSIGYLVESSDKFGEMFTWATPPDAVRS
ncbi:MAG: FkbM family methyltransferase [Chthoniobacterales bacterium]|nr:FkbM family methyltransferase [Chthoniobacterales bacterium]